MLNLLLSSSSTAAVLARYPLDCCLKSNIFSVQGIKAVKVLPSWWLDTKEFLSWEYESLEDPAIMVTCYKGILSRGYKSLIGPAITVTCYKGIWSWGYQSLKGPAVNWHVTEEFWIEGIKAVTVCYYMTCYKGIFSWGYVSLKGPAIMVTCYKGILNWGYQSGKGLLLYDMLQKGFWVEGMKVLKVLPSWWQRGFEDFILVYVITIWCLHQHQHHNHQLRHHQFRHEIFHFFQQLSSVWLLFWGFASLKDPSV